MSASLVLLTVGRNPLPCLVEAYRICKWVQCRSQEFPDFVVIQTRHEETARIREALIARLEREEQKRVALNWSVILIEDEGDPAEIHRKVREFCGRLDRGCDVHCAYTGGTSAMGIHTFEAAKECFSSVHGSYLHAGTHRLRSGSEIDYYAATPGRTDERMHWRLSLTSLAKLHGWNELPSPGPKEQAVRISRRFLRELVRNPEPYYEWLNREWKRAFRMTAAGGGGRGDLDQDVWIDHLAPQKWPRKIVEWLPPTDPDWHALGPLLRDAFGGGNVWKEEGATARLAIQVNYEQRRDIVPLYHFLDNQALELYVYSELRELLPESTPVAHSVKFRPSLKGSKDFELDVTAVLGYQILAISCTTSRSYKTCKLKAFEILHRTAQVGGGQASSILVTMLNPKDTSTLQEDMAADVAGNSQDLLVVGRETWSDVATTGSPAGLKRELRTWLQRMGWNEFRNDRA